MTIELAAGDPRIPVIEALLFGPAVAPPVSALPPPPPPIPPPAPPLPPRLVVPAAYRAFWKALGPRERLDLALLAEREYQPEELERALGLRRMQLKGRHGIIGRRAGESHLPFPIVARGRYRTTRRFSLRDEFKPFVRELAARDAARAAEEAREG